MVGVGTSLWAAAPRRARVARVHSLISAVVSIALLQRAGGLRSRFSVQAALFTTLLDLDRYGGNRSLIDPGPSPRRLAQARRPPKGDNADTL